MTRVSVKNSYDIFIMFNNIIRNVSSYVWQLYLATMFDIKFISMEINEKDLSISIKNVFCTHSHSTHVIVMSYHPGFICKFRKSLRSILLYKLVSLFPLLEPSLVSSLLPSMFP